MIGIFIGCDDSVGFVSDKYSPEYHFKKPVDSLTINRNGLDVRLYYDSTSTSMQNMKATVIARVPINGFAIMYDVNKDLTMEDYDVLYKK